MENRPLLDEDDTIDNMEISFTQHIEHAIKAAVPLIKLRESSFAPFPDNIRQLIREKNRMKVSVFNLK